MKKIRKRSNPQVWLLRIWLCVLCATSLVSVALGIVNLANTLQLGSSGELAERESRDLSQEMKRVSREADELEANISDFVGLLSSELDSIQKQVLELSTLRNSTRAVPVDNETTILEGASGQNDSMVVTELDIPSDSPTVVPTMRVNLTVRANCKTLKQHCSVTSVPVPLVHGKEPSNSSVNFNYCTTIATHFHEPDMQVTDVFCEIAGQSHGNRPRTSTLRRFEDGSWSCICYGLAVRNNQIATFECTMAATLCPKQISV